MSAFLLGWFRLIWLFTIGHQALVLENLALRQQLGVYKRNRKRPRLSRSDRVFWMVLARVWKGWRQVLVLVHPDTVVRGQRQRFRRYWAHLSGKAGRRVGRPSLSKAIRSLIQTMVQANPLWRAPRIHGELLKFGIRISERTVSRILQTIPRPPSQNWKTFLRNLCLITAVASVVVNRANYGLRLDIPISCRGGPTCRGCWRDCGSERLQSSS